MRRFLLGLLLGVAILFLPSPAAAQTPDTSTPAEEEACTKYDGEGARQGLCIAYCEAQDCDATKGFNPSCSTIAERFISYSVKQGYVPGPKEKSAISCNVTACSAEDAKLCGGKEMDCLSKEGGCEQICTATFVGRDPLTEKPLCSVSELCKPCVGKDPVK